MRILIYATMVERGPIEEQPKLTISPTWANNQVVFRVPNVGHLWQIFPFMPLARIAVAIGAASSE